MSTVNISRHQDLNSTLNKYSEHCVRDMNRTMGATYKIVPLSPLLSYLTFISRDDFFLTKELIWLMHHQPSFKNDSTALEEIDCSVLNWYSKTFGWYQTRALKLSVEFLYPIAPQICIPGVNKNFMAHGQVCSFLLLAHC